MFIIFIAFRCFTVYQVFDSFSERTWRISQCSEPQGEAHGCDHYNDHEHIKWWVRLYIVVNVILFRCSSVCMEFSESMVVLDIFIGRTEDGLWTTSTSLYFCDNFKWIFELILFLIVNHTHNVNRRWTHHLYERRRWRNLTHLHGRWTHRHLLLEHLADNWPHIHGAITRNFNLCEARSFMYFLCYVTSLGIHCLFSVIIGLIILTHGLSLNLLEDAIKTIASGDGL